MTRALFQSFVPLVVAVSLAAGGIFLLDHLGFFDFGDSVKAALGTGTTAAQATVMGAGLALTGVLATAAVTFVGLTLKFSIDDRTHQLAKEAEKRLQLEAVVQASALLGTSSGTNASSAQTGAALFSLAKLGQVEVALALLGPLWATKKVESDMAVLVIQEGLLSEKSDLMNAAAQVLDDNAERLPIPDQQLAFPARWIDAVPIEGKVRLLAALGRAFTMRPWNEWNRGIIRWAVEWVSAATRDKKTVIKFHARVLLEGFLQVNIWREVNYIQSATGPIAVQDVRDIVKSLESLTELEDDWVPAFRAWATSSTTSAQGQVEESAQGQVEEPGQKAPQEQH